MRRSTPWRAEALVCLPFVVALTLATAFYVRTVLDVRDVERERVSKAYRALAEEIRTGEATDVRRIARTTERAWGRLGKGSWGVSPQADGAFVWYRAPKDDVLAGRTVAAVRPRPVVRNMTCVGLFALVVMLAMLDVGFRLYRRHLHSREDFIAATVHDLTTPLVAMRRMIGSDDAFARSLNERLLRIVANLRDFMRLDGHCPPPKLVPVDLQAAYAGAYALFQADYRDLAQGEDVSLTCEGVAPYRVLADETRLQQIVWNLLANDLKHAAPYGRVRACLRRAGERVMLVLTDEGPGMTAWQRRRAFVRYYRAQAVLRSGCGGFGIGLTVARELARSFGGDLTVAENKPHGCVFTLTLRAADERSPQT